MEAERPMANNENTLTPAGGREPIDLRRFLDAAAGEGLVLDGVDAADLFNALFASAPASAPLPLTDERILSIWQDATPSYTPMPDGGFEFAHAIARECLAAPPVGAHAPEPLMLLRELVEANQELADYKASDGLEGYRRMRARERAAWQAAHSFFDPAALSNSGAAGKGITRLSSEGESGGGKA